MSQLHKKIYIRLYKSLVFNFCIAACMLSYCTEQVQSSQVETSNSVDLVAQVNVFMGTSGDHGQLSPAASLPFGMVKLGPETDPVGHSGYNYEAALIEGFTHNRSEGVGCVGAGGNILIKPGLGQVSTKPSPYQKETERGAPGYYSVMLGLGDSAIKTELTVSNGTGWHKYDFPKKAKKWIMIDLRASHEEFIAETHEFTANDKIEGSVEAYTVCKQNGGKYKFYYQIAISAKVSEVVEQEGKIFLLLKSDEEKHVNVKVSLSTISPIQAVKDREVEIGHKTFEEVRATARQLWQEKLSKIRVKGNLEDKKLFYSNLYRSFLAPYNTTSSDSTYRGSDGKIYVAEGFTYYHGWSIWDNFRTQLPLLTIIEPNIMLDICKSLVALYKQGKYNWASTTEPFPTVRTEHSSVVLLDAYRKGISDFDLKGVYPYLIQELDSLPYTSPDNILESSYDYWAVSEIAGILGKAEDQQKYLNKAKEFETIYKEKFQVMDAQSDIMHGDGLYEGTLWQYRWFVPWNIAKMKELIGGEEAFEAQLDQFFESDFYNHGNQPDLQAPFLYNFTKNPWKTQEIVNKILTKDLVQWYGTHRKWETPYKGKIYKNAAKGYLKEMDDDAGTMSSWFVLASMGLYPVNVGEPLWQITTPIFEEVSINVQGEKAFNIKTTNFNDSTFYIDEIKLEDDTYTNYFLKHQAIIEGKGLDLHLEKK